MKGLVRAAVVAIAVVMVVGIAAMSLSLYIEPWRIFLNSNNGSLSALFGALVALSTVVYAVLTGFLVVETRRLREAQTTPDVSVRLEPRQEWINFIDVIVENTGMGPALDVQFRVIDDFALKNGDRLGKFNIFQHGMKFVAPRQRVQSFFTSLVGEMDADPLPQATVEVSFKDRLGKIITSTYVLSTSQFMGLSQLGEPPLNEISRSLKDLKDCVCRFVGGQGNAKVVAWTKSDEDERMAGLRAKRDEIVARADSSPKEKPATASESQGDEPKAGPLFRTHTTGDRMGGRIRG